MYAYPSCKSNVAQQEAIDRYGFFWNAYTREAIKSQGRSTVQDQSTSLEERYVAQMNVFKALFSRSVQFYGVKDHPDFPDYVAMLLNQDHQEELLHKDLYDLFVKKYGKKKGICGANSIYTGKPKKIRSRPSISDADICFALFGGDKDITDEQFEEVKRYALYLKERKKNDNARFNQ